MPKSGTSGKRSSTSGSPEREIAARFRRLPSRKTGRGLLSPEQRSIIEATSKEWRKMNTWDRPALSDVVKLWAEYGIKTSLTTTRRWLDGGIGE